MEEKDKELIETSKQQIEWKIIYHYVPKIQDAILKEKIHEKLAEKEGSQLSALYALKVWFDKEDK